MLDFFLWSSPDINTNKQRLSNTCYSLTLQLIFISICIAFISIRFADKRPMCWMLGCFSSDDLFIVIKQHLSQLFCLYHVFVIVIAFVFVFSLSAFRKKTYVLDAWFFRLMIYSLSSNNTCLSFSVCMCDCDWIYISHCICICISQYICVGYLRFSSDDIHGNTCLRFTLC